MAERSYNERDTLALLNPGFESSPTFVAATATSARWIDGTSGGSTSNDIYKWAVNSIGGSASAQFDSANARTGGAGLKVSTTATASSIAVGQVRAQSTATLVVQYGIKVRPNTTYNLSGWYKTLFGSGDATRGAHLRVEQFNAAGASITSNDTTYVKTTTDWTNYTLSVTTRTNCYYITVQCIISGNLGTGTLIMDAWFDDISLTEVLPARTTVTRTAITQPRVATRDMGTALRFDGVTAQVSIGATPALLYDTSVPHTMAAWVKYPRIQGINNRGIIDKWQSSSGVNRFGTRLSLNATGSLVFQNGAGAGSDTGDGITSSKMITLNKWTFVVGVYTGTSLILYQDNTAYSVATALASNLTGTFLIGDTHHSNGKSLAIIDEPRFWNRALSATEVANMYYNNIIPRTGLVAEYLFNETTGTTALDTSGNGNHGTHNCTYTTDTPLQLRSSV